MGITEKDIRYLAVLSRLAFSADEIPRYQTDIQNILNYVAELQLINVEGLMSSVHASDATNVFRDDVAIISPAIKGIMNNGPEVEDHAFKVPQILTE